MLPLTELQIFALAVAALPFLICVGAFVIDACWNDT